VTLKEKAERRYWERVRDKAGELGTDGCSYATGAFQECCLEHDIHERTGATLDGKHITAKESDARFRACMQSRSKLGFFSPVAWGRWSVLRLKRRFLGSNFK
jgi:hypothetical protein